MNVPQQSAHPSVRVRRLAGEQVATLRQLNTLFAEVFDDAASYASRPPPDAYLADLLAKPQVVALVAEAEGVVVGGLVAYELEKLEQARSEIYIYDLAVAATHRRRGIATALVHALQAIARDRGAWAIYVQADFGDEPAVALYTKLGSRQDVMHFDIPILRD